MPQIIFDLLYLICCILLILGLKGLSNPKTARKGNIYASIALGLGILISLIYPLPETHNNFIFIALGISIGAIIGIFSAKRVAMTAMPEMVSLFNGFGGLCAFLISLVWVLSKSTTELVNSDSLIVYVNLIIGGVAFTGSMVAYGKLSGTVKDKHLRIPFVKLFNLLMLTVLISTSVFLSKYEFLNTYFIILIIVSWLYGIVFVAPIGGADMPVVISLLNSFTGVTAAVSGIITDDKLMLLGGILVGSSGTVLTVLMCKAMNRSLLNVIIGSFSGNTASATTDSEGTIKEIALSDLAVMLAYSQRVAIVPGYGMAVSQAQKTCKELESTIEEKGVEVGYCIHPVAGRMPGHMNVLLAEADVDYSKLYDLDQANDFLNDTDVAIIVGANDVVNPSAKEDPNSNIYGMPIIEVTKSKNIVILKRSMNPGYAGIQNPLFFHEKSRMFFGDAKKSLGKIVSEIKNI